MPDHAEARDNRPTYTTTEVAAMFDITRQTLDRWMKAGRIPRPMKDPRSQTYMWTQPDIDNLAKIIRNRGTEDSE